MALIGNIKKTYTNNSAFTAILDWTASQNYTNNTSTVVGKLWIKSNSSYGVAPNWNGVKATITIDSSTSPSTSINTAISGNGVTGYLMTFSKVVNHTSDGSKKFDIAFSISFADVVWHGSRIGTVSQSGNFTLDSIPRASTLTISKSSAVIGETSLTFNINRATTAFKHDVYWSWEKDKFSTQNVTWGYIGSSQTTGASVSGVIPLAPLVKLMHTTTSTFIYIYLDTFSGNNRIGRKVYTLDVSLPETVAPTAVNLTTEETDPKTKTVLGSSGTATTVFVQGKSQVQVGAYANLYSGDTGGSFTRYQFYSKISNKPEEFWGENKTGWFTYQFNSYIYYSGEVELICYAYDQRGRYTRIAKKVTLLTYKTPSISSFSGKRSLTNTSSADFFYNTTFSSLKVEGVEKNKNWIRFKTKRNDGTLWESQWYLESSGSKTIGGWVATMSYETTLEVMDVYDNTAYSLVIIGTTKKALTLREDIGIGAGKIHEQGSVDAAEDIYIAGQRLSIRNGFLNYNNSDVVGYLSNANGDAVWFYDGTMICWKNFIDATGPCNIAYGSLFSTPNQIWTFPSSFYDYPAVSVHVVGGGSYAWGAHGAGGTTRNNAPWMVYGAISISTRPQGSLIAIGRWKE